MKDKVLKDKKCKECKEKFTPQRPLQYLCSPHCAYKYGDKLVEKKSKKEHKIAKEGLLTHKDYIQLLQKVVNTFIRLRDKDQNCISCDITLQGKKYDAGHFYPTTYQVLRFHEDNIHAQCVRCNRDLHGNQVEYLPRLEDKIGVDKLQWLHAHRHDRLDMSIPEIKEMIKEYKKKIVELK